MARQMPMWFSKRNAMFHEINEESRIEVVRVAPTSTAPPCLKINQKVTPTDSLTDKAKMQFMRLSLPVRCRKAFVRTKDREELIRKIQELQKRNPSVATIRGPGLPKEFAEMDDKKDKKSLGKTLLSAFRHNSHDEDARSQKHSSFDAGSYHESLIDPPAVA